jgi:molybdate transport system substrate-binding protein
MAERDGVVDQASVKLITYLIPAILVQKGNPKNIKSLADLARPGIDVGIGNPEAVCVGLYAYEILEYNKMLETVRPNIVTNAESCDKTATLVAIKAVDAVIGWSVFASWHDTIDVVYFKPEQIPRLAYVPGAISNYTKDGESARKFLDFLVSTQGQEIFSKWGYINTEDEARKFAPDAEIGGEYQLPATYKTLAK